MKIYSLETRNNLIYSWHRMLNEARNQCTMINELPKGQRRSRSRNRTLSGAAHIVEWLMLPDDADILPSTARMVYTALHIEDTGDPTRGWFARYLDPNPGQPMLSQPVMRGYVIRRFMEMGHVS
jgi:hypothetical protein